MPARLHHRIALATFALVSATPLLAADSNPTSAHAAHADCPLAASHPVPEALPEQVGQDAFAALGEMRGLLLADPATDWSRADLDALREHLVDMNRVVLDAEVTTRPVPQGFEATVTGTGRTLEAIHRMIPAHARFVDGQDSLRVTALPLDDAHAPRGLLVRVTTSDDTAVDRVRGLGFFGLMTAGDHHRPHHAAMARGSGHP